MALPVTKMRTLISEASGYTDDELEALLEVATEFVSETVFLHRYETALAYFAGHLLVLGEPDFSGAAGAAGPITGERAGEVARQYGFSQTGRAADDSLFRTKYGLMYKNVQKATARTKMLSTIGTY